ncbi:hypothetical protein BJ170DRAFT_637582 [Xylariales sp. AK1849]|nr:hypothetical protein BJ170DRAFT_637582 [Xylariales sp. AK1849]
MESTTSICSMRQRRICEYLGVDCTHSLSFLVLSSAIRQRIYCEAGLVTDAYINLNGRPHAATSDNLQLSYNLLLVCRVIYTEVSSIIYSSNRFFIRYRDSGNFEPLRNLRAPSLLLLAHLEVYLNVSSCEVDQPCCKAYPEHSRCCRKHDKPLTTSSRRHRAILLEWQNVAGYIIAHITSSRLRLHLICDVENDKVAKRIIEPLLNLPRLADYSIRLGQQPDPLLQDLVQQTAIRALGGRSDQSSCPFRFLDLPQELRYKILEYTDLVTPLSEVEWNPQKGFYLRYSVWRCNGARDCPPEVHYACQFRNCWENSNVRCFCRRYHSAYTSSCNCWSPPTSFFLVCHALRKDSQAVFFKKNRFVITPAHGCNRVANNTPSRLEISLFLTEIMPPDAIGFLRFLEVVFSPFDTDYLRFHEPAYQDWLQTIDYISDKLHLPTLTIQVYMADHYPNGQGVTPFRNNMTREQGMTVIAMYARTLGPLRKLDRMSRFFVHLAWPFT